MDVFISIQIVMILLKLMEITSVASLSWLAVFIPTFVVIFFVLLEAAILYIAALCKFSISCEVIRAYKVGSNSFGKISYTATGDYREDKNNLVESYVEKFDSLED